MSDLKTLSEQLAERVAQKLVQAGLFREERQNALAVQISSGKMKADSWRLDIELALDRGQKS